MKLRHLTIVLWVFTLAALAVGTQAPVVREVPQIYQEIAPNSGDPDWREFNARYGGVPLPDRVHYYRTWQLSQVVLRQENEIQALQKRLAALEKAANPAEVPAEPVEAGKPAEAGKSKP